ncbi:MAG: PKD domain-containing protein [Elusimicrobia bacterium]|nr:PKD domain-containing protein [Elusimicrobiota bacterium]
MKKIIIPIILLSSAYFAYAALPMTTASRTSGIAPLGVTFNACNKDGFISGIVQPKGFDRQPNMPGIRITHVNAHNPTGNGTLTLHEGKITWEAPGDSVGRPVPVTNGGSFIIPSGNENAKIHLWVNPHELNNGVDTIAIIEGGDNANYNSWHYHWEFGDPACGFWEHGAQKADGSQYSKNEEFGWLAAHVFKWQGIYTVYLTVINDVGNTYEYEQIIDVKHEPTGGWKIYNFAEDGDDENGNGSLEKPFKTWEKARTLIDQNVKLLFKRGDNFDFTDLTGSISTQGPLYIGAWGNGERPRFFTTSINSFIRGGDDARFVDLWVDGAYPEQDGRVSGGFPMGFGPGSDSLVLDCKIQDLFFGCNTPNNKEHVVVQDCIMQNNQSYGIWVNGDTTGINAFMGCSLLQGHEEALFRSYASRVILSHNDFSLPSWKNTIRFHCAGNSFMPGQWWIGYNKLTEMGMTINSESGADALPPRHVAVIGNRFEYYDEAIGHITSIGVSSGEHVLISNNTVHSTKQTVGNTFVTLSQGYNDGPYEHNVIRVLGNSIYAATTDTGRLFTAGTEVGKGEAWWLMNNIFSLPDAAKSDYGVPFIRISNFRAPDVLVSDNNIYNTPKWHKPEWRFEDLEGKVRFEDWQTRGLDRNSHMVDPLFQNVASGDLRIESGSVGVDGGASTMASYNRIDADYNVRPYDGNSIGLAEWDMGAYEYGSKPDIEFPAIVIGADPQEGHAPLTVMFFIEQQTTPNGPITSYAWDFGDDSTSLERAPLHKYKNPGTYRAALTITDGRGYRADDSIKITVLEETLKPEDIPVNTQLTVYNNVIKTHENNNVILYATMHKAGKLNITVYDTQGRKMKTLVDEERQAGIHEIMWDGKTGAGNTVGSGIYFIHMKTGDFYKTGKIAVIK